MVWSQFCPAVFLISLLVSSSVLVCSKLLSNLFLVEVMLWSGSVPATFILVYLWLSNWLITVKVNSLVSKGLAPAWPSLTFGLGLFWSWFSPIVNSPLPQCCVNGWVNSKGYEFPGVRGSSLQHRWRRHFIVSTICQWTFRSISAGQWGPGRFRRLCLNRFKQLWRQLTFNEADKADKSINCFSFNGFILIKMQPWSKYLVLSTWLKVRMLNPFCNKNT